MFTGIIGSIGIIESAKQEGDLKVKIACDYRPDSIKPGDSVAVNGVCLTIVTSGRWQVASKKGIACHFTATLSTETLTRTAPRWNKGTRVNLERALKMGDTLDGHLVTGHIDGIAIIQSISPPAPPQAGGVVENIPPVHGGEGGETSHVLKLEAPNELARFIAAKGSVCLDGVSLTVNKVENNRFWVNIIPHTWQHTTLSERKPGDGLNLEIDLIARYTARLLQK